ncbi:MAG TPA: triose-phosphate isomerase [Actinomycetes bacterium]|nr:triose-phosphate isomerase [Actinomycetes bacterium]
MASAQGSPRRKPLMAGNWKMNLNHLEAIHLVQDMAFRLDEKDFDAVDVVLLPPFTDLRSVQTLIDADHLMMRYGAQDISEHDGGAYTGEVSGAMLAKLGCDYVTVGHSERRQHHHETDAVVAAKARAALRHGLVPIVCVGEPLAIRQQGDHVSHVLAQVAGSLADISDLKDIVVAYEPVWAIGTGEVATPADAQEVCAAIRATMGELGGAEVAAAARVLYGGSVKGDTTPGIMAQPDVDGALVGGASLAAAEFVSIVRYQQAGPHDDREGGTGAGAASGMAVAP